MNKTPEKSKSVARFLTALAKTGNPSVACRASTMTRREVDVLRETDAAFALSFQHALDEAADLLEAEAWRRALEGISQPIMKAGKPVIDPDTGQAVMVRRYSDALLMLLLRGSRPGKFGPRASVAARENVGQIIREIAADDDPPRRQATPYREEQL